MLAAGPIQIERLIRNYLELDRLMEAMVVAKKGIRDFPSRLEFRVLLADVYRRGGKIRPAREQLERALQLDPEHAGARAALDRLAD